MTTLTLKISWSQDELETLLPSDVYQLLTACPQTGGGVHKWLAKVATRLHRFFGDKNIIAGLLEKYSSGCGREVSSDEIWGAIKSTERWLARLKNGEVPATPKPKESAKDTALVEETAKNGPTMAELASKSPVRWSEEAPHTEEILLALFPAECLVCVGESESYFGTVSLALHARIKALRRLQFIVPSPMSARAGKTKNGKVSAHTLDNTGPRRFLVIEFDEGTTDTHAALLWHLAQRERLALVVHSAGKSLHGWFWAEGRSEEEMRSLMSYAIRLGADPATWTTSQFVRMPDGRRENNKKQKVVYFDPSRKEAQ